LLHGLKIRTFNKSKGGNMENTDTYLLRRDTRKVRSMYKEFNKAFFRNQLPHYDVEVVEAMPDGGACIGGCDRERKQIFLRRDAAIVGRDFRSVLLHEMCHIRLPDDDTHGWRFLAQLRRLQRMGETWVQDELDCLTIDTPYTLKWQQRMATRLVVIAKKNPDLTLDRALNQLTMECAVTEDELRKWIPDLEGGWRLLSFFSEQIASSKLSVKRYRKMRRSLGHETFGVAR